MAPFTSNNSRSPILLAELHVEVRWLFALSGILMTINMAALGFMWSEIYRLEEKVDYHIYHSQ